MTLTPPPATFLLGVSRLFGTCDLGSEGLVHGWANPEETHLWNDGPDARMDIEIDGPPVALGLIITGGPFLSPASLAQPMTLYVNGYRVGYWLLRDSGTVQLSTTISPEQVFVRDGGLNLSCVWHLPASISPLSTNLGDDTRELGFCFQSIRIIPN